MINNLPKRKWWCQGFGDFLHRKQPVSDDSLTKVALHHPNKSVFSIEIFNHYTYFMKKTFFCGLCHWLFLFVFIFLQFKLIYPPQKFFFFSFFHYFDLNRNICKFVVVFNSMNSADILKNIASIFLLNFFLLLFKLWFRTLFNSTVIMQNLWNLTD